MRLSLTTLALAALLSAAPGAVAADEPRKVDEYDAVNCEYEMARLDYFAIEVQNAPAGEAVAVVYGGRRGTRRGEVAARVNFIRHYLIFTRGLEARRVRVFDGGFRESLTTELYLAPAGSDARRLVRPTVRSGDVRYRRGRVGSRSRVSACYGIG